MQCPITTPRDCEKRLCSNSGGLRRREEVDQSHQALGLEPPRRCSPPSLEEIRCPRYNDSNRVAY